MSTETGTGTDFSDIMGKLIIFMTTFCGFTLEGAFSGTQNLSYNGTSTGTVYTIRCLSRGGVYWWFRYTNNNMFCLLSTGTGATWNTIANRSPNDSEVNLLTGSYTKYRFFEVNDEVWVALTRLNGGVTSYNHFGLGKIQKHGTWTGGEFFATSYQEVSGTFYNNKDSQYHTRLFGNKSGAQTSGTGGANSTRAGYGVIRCTYNSKDYANIDRDYNAVETGMNEALSIGGLVHQPHSSGTSITPSPVLDDSYSPNLWSDTAVASPPQLMLYDNAGSGRYLDLGYVTGVRFLNVANIDADALINTDWRAYPCSHKGETGAADYAASGNYGVAFREVA